MVRNNVTKRVGSGKPLRQFKAPKRPEITRLPLYDDADSCLPTNIKALTKVPARTAALLLLTSFGCGKTNPNLFRN